MPFTTVALFAVLSAISGIHRRGYAVSRLLSVICLFAMYVGGLREVCWGYCGSQNPEGSEYTPAGSVSERGPDPESLPQPIRGAPHRGCYPNTGGCHWATS